MRVVLSGGQAESIRPARRLQEERHEGGEGRWGAALIVAFIVLVAPLSYFLGVDSRLASDRGWVGSDDRR